MGILLLVLGLGVATFALMRMGGQEPAERIESSSVAPSEPIQEVPPFNQDVESAKPFPALLNPARFADPVVARAYEIAHEIPEVLAQQPCYCYCDVFGHGSLLDCFASEHGAT